MKRDGENGEQRWEGERKGDSCFKMIFFCYKTKICPLTRRQKEKHELKNYFVAFKQHLYFTTSQNNLMKLIKLSENPVTQVWEQEVLVNLDQLEQMFYGSQKLVIKGRLNNGFWGKKRKVEQSLPPRQN